MRVATTRSTILFQRHFLLVADAPEVFPGSDEDVAIGHGLGGIAHGVVQRVGGDQVELRAGCQNHHFG